MCARVRLELRLSFNNCTFLYIQGNLYPRQRARIHLNARSSSDRAASALPRHAWAGEVVGRRCAARAIVLCDSHKSEISLLALGVTFFFSFPFLETFENTCDDFLYFIAKIFTRAHCNYVIERQQLLLFLSLFLKLQTLFRLVVFDVVQFGNLIYLRRNNQYFQFELKKVYLHINNNQNKNNYLKFKLVDPSLNFASSFSNIT